MGRTKVELKKLESAWARSTTFSKRYKGITKKARELSVLCDVPVLLVTTTTSGGYKVFAGENSNFRDVVQQYVNESEENLAKTKKETLESLRKSFTNGHVVNVPCEHPVEGEEDSLIPLEKATEEIAELKDFLGPLRNLNQLEKVESIDELLAMERSVRTLLAKNKEIKERILEQQKASFQQFFASYASGNPTGRMQLHGPVVGSDNYPTGRVLQHGPTFGSGKNPTEIMQLHGPIISSDNYPSGSVPQQGPIFGWGMNQTESVQQHSPIVGSSSNPTGSMLQHDPTFGSGSYPTESAQQHGPTFDNGINPTGSMLQHDPTFGSGSNPTESAQQHGPIVDSGSNQTESTLQRDPTFGSGSNLTESAQQHGLIVDSGSDPTLDQMTKILLRKRWLFPEEMNRLICGSMLQHTPTFGSGSNPTGSTQQHDPIVDSGSNPTGSMLQHDPTLGSGSNPTESSQQHDPIVGSSSSPTVSMQLHGPTVGSDMNPTGSVLQHGPTFGSAFNSTESMQQYGPTVGSDNTWSYGPQNLSRNMPEKADFQDSNSDLDPLPGILSEGDGLYEHTQDEWDEISRFFSSLNYKEFLNLAAISNGENHLFGSEAEC